MARRRVDHQACGLVDDQQVLVFVHHRQGHGLRHEGHGLGRGPQLHRAGVAGAHLGGRLGAGAPAQCHRAIGHELLQPGARETLHQGHQSAVQAPAVHLCRHKQRTNLTLCIAQPLFARLGLGA